MDTILCLVYTDDILLTAPNLELLLKFKDIYLQELTDSITFNGLYRQTLGTMTFLAYWDTEYMIVLYYSIYGEYFSRPFTWEEFYEEFDL